MTDTTNHAAPEVNIASVLVACDEFIKAFTPNYALDEYRSLGKRIGHALAENSKRNERLDALTREAEELRLRVDALTSEGKWISSRVHIATMAAKEATIAAQSERIAKLEILLQEALDDQRTDDMPPFDPACCWQCRARIALAALAQKETEPTRHRIEINETETFQTTNIQPKITKEAP